MDTITEIPLEQLHESTANPRRTYTGIDELAASIRAEGRIHEPLLVRPRITNVLRPDEHDGYELVFGHRRLRAAEAAGLATAPCMVRAMSDVEAASARAAENLQREDLHPIEEAEGLKALLDVGNLSADQLADKLGKSRSFVYGRLKLLQACPEVRKACAEGKIGSEVALLIARLRTDRLQAKALGYIRGKYIDMGDGGAKSFRQIRQLLNEHFTLELKGALFDTADATLLPDAGACDACPKRAGNAPEYADIADQRPERGTGLPADWAARVPHGGADVCTDPDCFDAKKRAHLRNQAAALEAKGKTVVAGNAARAAVGADGTVKGAYIALKDVKAEMKAALAAKKTVTYSDQMPKVVLIQDPRTGKTIEAVKREEAVQVGVKVPAAAAPGRDGYAAQEARRQAEHARNEERAKLENQVRLAVLRDLRDAMMDRERDAFDLGLVAVAAWRGVEWRGRAVLAQLWGVSNERALEQRIGSMDVQQLTLLIMDCALVADCVVTAYNLHEKPTTLLKAAAHYDIDVDQVRAEVAPAPAPAPAAASKPAPKAARKAKPTQPAVRYRCPATGSTWSGRGLQPAWLKVALADGKTLSDFAVDKPKAPATSKPKAKDGDAADAELEPRDTRTLDMFAEAG
ncbi:MAG: ParB/RepB/Spo0J family partition protein [Burkholderiales bacterium]|nr:ParB/RepB/Spo0J family partition protein [Burkholderiales bacterium]